MHLFSTPRYRRSDSSMAPCPQAASASPVPRPAGSLPLVDAPHVDVERMTPDRGQVRSDVAGRPLVLQAEWRGGL